MYDETEAYVPGFLDDFSKRLSESNGTPGKPFYMPNGTPFFCTASGTLLKKGLADWAGLPESERKPGAVVVPAAKEDAERVRKSRRLTKPPAGALILRTYIRGLKLDEQQRLFAPKVIDWNYNSKLPAEPNRDFVWLKEEEWQSIIPTNPIMGKKTQMPDAVRDRICHWHIAGGYHCLPGYYVKDSFKFKAMWLVVDDVTPQSITLRVHGAAAIPTDAAYRFHGVIRYDTQKKAITRFDLIALCDEGHDPNPRPQNVAPYRHYGVAFELSGERTDDLLPPFYLRENVGTPENYFRNATR